jgi:adenylate cyclase
VALFGLDVDPAASQEPIQFGMGIHGGESLSATSVFADHTVFTALGDAVTARLQDMTKTLNCTIVISEEVCNNAGLTAVGLTRTDVAIRGRDEPMSVRMAVEPTLLTSLLDEQDGSPTAEEKSAKTLV